MEHLKTPKISHLNIQENAIDNNLQYMPREGSTNTLKSMLEYVLVLIIVGTLAFILVDLFYPLGKANEHTNNNVDNAN